MTIIAEVAFDDLFVLSACGCSPLGTIDVCDPKDGKCTCKRFVMGARCDRCQVRCVLRAHSFPKGSGIVGKSSLKRTDTFKLSL